MVYTWMLVYTIYMYANILFYSKASPLKFILLFAMLHVLGGRDNFDDTRLQPVPTTLHIVQLVC